MTDPAFNPPPDAGLRPAPPPGWFMRNWKWLVPSLLVGLGALCVAGVALMVLLLMGSLKSSEPYRQALSAARSNPVLQMKLGTPIEDGWLVSGSINLENSSGKADLSFPVHGPKGKGTLFVAGTKTAGQWTLTKLEAEVEGQAGPVPLLDADPTVEQ